MLLGAIASVCVNVVNAFYLLVKERQIISTFIKMRFEFISAVCKSFVGKTNTAKSKS